MTTSSGVRLGATLYAFTHEFHDGQYSFDQLIAKIAELGLGPGLEIEGFQSIRGFPHVSDEFAYHFKSLVDRYGLEPSCLGTNMDPARRPDRLMTPEEEVVYLEAQLKAARKLGFPVARVYGVSIEALERFLPVAERFKVKMGLEIHSPAKVSDPNIVVVRELVDRMGSPYLGFIPDFGASMIDIPPGILESFRREGMAADLIDLLLEVWHKDTETPEKIAELSERARTLGADERDMSHLLLAVRWFGKEKPHAWLELLPQTVHIHGKFYEFDEAGNAVAVPYPEIIGVLKEGNYQGVMSLEWEGHAWMEDLDGFTVVKMQHDLCERLLAGTPVPASGR
jgi:sugar phosphate isomerase/epimerase